MEKDAEKAKEIYPIVAIEQRWVMENDCMDFVELVDKMLQRIKEALSQARSEGYNEAIAEAVKVAKSQCPSDDNEECGCDWRRIADKIRGLKKEIK